MTLNPETNPLDAISLAQGQIAAAADTLRDRLTRDADTIDGLEQENARLETRLVSALARSRMLVGADPSNGLSAWGPAGLLSVAQKYGDGASVRAFGSAGAVANRPDPRRISRIHYSWAAPTSAGKIAIDATHKIVSDEARVAAGFANAVDGDEVELTHELDSKVNKGMISLDDGIRLKAAFHATVDRLRDRGDLAAVNVVNTLTGWAADPKNSLTRGDVTRYMRVPAEILGVDFDGITPGDTYPDFFDEVGTVAETLARTPGYAGWKVPEFGAPRMPSDTTGQVRGRWMDAAFSAFSRTGCRSVEVYDYNLVRDHRIPDASPELDVCRYWVAASRVA